MLKAKREKEELKNKELWLKVEDCDELSKIFALKSKME
jgi:hypothetical protein